MRVDLNADVGESFGAFKLGHDALLMPSITSASIACGFHAGDPGVMRETVALALAHGVAIGAHPAFPDLVGFGRRELAATPREVEDFVTYQIGALAAIAAAQGARLNHVKAHGALYTMAARDAALAGAIARATASVDRALVVLGPPGSHLVRAAVRAGLRTAGEGFADRAYERDGSLTPRSRAGALIDDDDLVAHRAVRMVTEGTVMTADGEAVPLAIDTICVHGDTPGAAHLAARIRAALTAAGVRIAPSSEV